MRAIPTVTYYFMYSKKNSQHLYYEKDFIFKLSTGKMTHYKPQNSLPLLASILWSQTNCYKITILQQCIKIIKNSSVALKTKRADFYRLFTAPKTVAK
jgi:hypothetical protein